MLYIPVIPDEVRSNPVKAHERWWSDRLQQHFGVARWGHFGTPVLLFPTAGGDEQEVERNQLVSACGDLLEAGRGSTTLE